MCANAGVIIIHKHQIKVIKQWLEYFHAQWALRFWMQVFSFECFHSLWPELFRLAGSWAIILLSPLQSELRLLLLVLDDLTDGLPGGRDALLHGQVRVKVQQVLVLLRGRCLITVLCFWRNVQKRWQSGLLYVKLWIKPSLLMEHFYTLFQFQSLKCSPFLPCPNRTQSLCLIRIR